MKSDTPSTSVKRIVEVDKVTASHNESLIDNENVCSARWGLAMTPTGLRSIAKTTKTHGSPDGEKISHA